MDGDGDGVGGDASMRVCFAIKGRCETGSCCVAICCDWFPVS
jgi:hypothetical protein